MDTIHVHTKEPQSAEKVRRAGETELRWFAGKLGVEFEGVAAWPR